MNESNQKQLNQTLWSIADQLRGAMDADDFRDYMLSFLFLRYLSDNYETAAKKELGKDYPDVGGDLRKVPLALWYANNVDDIPDFEKQGALRHQARAPVEQHRQLGPHPECKAAGHAARGLQVH
jgi:type I restriction enzyme M protein